MADKIDIIIEKLTQVENKLDMLLEALADDEQNPDMFDFDGNSIGLERNQNQELWLTEPTLRLAA